MSKFQQFTLFNVKSKISSIYLIAEYIFLKIYVIFLLNFLSINFKKEFTFGTQKSHLNFDLFLLTLFYTSFYYFFFADLG